MFFSIHFHKSGYGGEVQFGSAHNGQKQKQNHSIAVCTGCGGRFDSIRITIAMFALITSLVAAILLVIKKIQNRILCVRNFLCVAFLHRLTTDESWPQ